MGVEVVDAAGTLKNLDHSSFALDLQDLALAGRAVWKLHIHYLGVFGKFDIVEDD